MKPPARRAHPPSAPEQAVQLGSGARNASASRLESGAKSGLSLARPRPSLALSLQFADASDRALLPRHKVVRWMRAALEAPGEITVRIVGLDEGRALNLAYRAKDHATNVLTFDYAREPVVVADLVLCAPVLQREAREMGIPLAAHYAHLLVHGTLHAQGWDHEAKADARAMEARETQLVQALDFPDPYAHSA